MDNFDLKKFLAEGKLHEFISAQDTEDIAGMVADEFTKESADEGDYLRYSVGQMDADDMSFELDTDLTSQSPKNIDTRGVGEGWGGIFRIKPTADGYEVRNAEKGGLVAMIDGAGNFKMLSAAESRAEMGMDDELDMDRYNDEPDMDRYNDELDMKRMEEGEEAPKSNKMKKSELKEMIKAAMLAEMEVEETEVYEADEEDVEVDTEEEVDVDVEDAESVDAGEMEVTQNADAGLTGEKKEVQDNLEAALEAAKALGDQKLVDQIGNSITFFTRQHVVGKAEAMEEGNKEYYKDAEADDAEHIKALEKDMKDDKEDSMKVNEVEFPMWTKLKNK